MAGCRCLCARLSPNLIAPEHLQGLFEVANAEADDKDDSAYLPAVLDVLVGCAAAAPALFADCATQVANLCPCEINILNKFVDICSKKCTAAPSSVPYSVL